MKKLIFLSILTFGFLTSPQAQQYGWQVINPTSINGTPDFSDVHVIDQNIAFISSSSQTNIFRTDDGAGSFSTQATSLATSTEAILMIDSSTGFCGGQSGFVYNTGNGGINWGFLGTMATLLTDMDFVSASQGYACGDGGAVFSIAGGVTNLNSGLASDLSGISSPSVDNVWVCGGNNISYYNGSTFAFQSGPVGTYNSIFFINDQEGWVVGTAGLIGHTVNGGNTWTSQTSPSSNSLYDVFFLDVEVGWAIGSQGTILYTSNGGDTWTVQGAGLTTAFLRGVHFTSPTNGYVVGNGKTLLKYTDILGIGDNKKIIDFEIFPNPTINKIQINCSEFKTESGTVEILSIEGKKLIEQNISTGNTTTEIDVSGLPNGIYFCAVVTAKGNAAQKLIIQK